MFHHLSPIVTLRICTTPCLSRSLLAHQRISRRGPRKKLKRRPRLRSESHTIAIYHSPQARLTMSSTPSLNKNGLVKVALRESMTSGSFIDTKFYAFSRRRRNGIVDSPLPIFANSELLRIGSKYFGDCMCTIPDRNTLIVTQSYRPI